MSRTLMNINQTNHDVVSLALNGLLEHRGEAYQQDMTILGIQLAKIFERKLNCSDKVLTVSTAEDADYLLSGIRKQLSSSNFRMKLVVFWNNHYSLSSGQSVAPIIHRYVESDYDDVNIIVIAKSVISGSCVVRTNLIALLEQVQRVDKIYVVAPVMHKKAEENLRNEFPVEISDKFEFITFAIDEEKNPDGEVKPGIGGQIYELLGLVDQPVRTGFIPQIVKNMVFG